MLPPPNRLTSPDVRAATLAAVLAWWWAAPAHASDEFAAAIDAMLAGGRHTQLQDGNFARDRETLRQLYERRQYQPVWIRNREPTRQAALLMQTLRAAEEFGLNPEDYDATPLAYNVIDFVTNRSANAALHAEIDLALSISASRLIRHLHFGRIDPWAGGFALNKPRAALDVGAVLGRLADGDDFAGTLSEVEPKFLFYRSIKRALLRYRMLAVEPDLSKLPKFKRGSIKPGEPYDGIPQLRRLLVGLGDLPVVATTSDTVLDDTLVAGIRNFQRRHGLTVDGALGPRTFAELTTPLSKRAEQLALTLERWRWMPELESPSIVVNIPQFKLFAFEYRNGEFAIALESDVIVGKPFPTHRTPAFTADMTYIVFRPYWDVPRSIQMNELLPEIRAKPSYFDSNNLEIVSAAGSNAPPIPLSTYAMEQLEAGALRLRQRPGNDNSLGLVKLMFPNPHNVYLHSTPALRLFEQTRRTFSHGCIRVGDIVGLTEYVLRNESGDWNRASIIAAMYDQSPTGDNRHVHLSKSIPVMIVYGTAIATQNGQAQFFEDIYGHDAKLRKLLRAQAKGNYP